VHPAQRLKELYARNTLGSGHADHLEVTQEADGDAHRVEARVATVERDHGKQLSGEDDPTGSNPKVIVADVSRDRPGPPALMVAFDGRPQTGTIGIAGHKLIRE
jgi:hypothetical protein